MALWIGFAGSQEYILVCTAKIAGHPVSTNDHRPKPYRSQRLVGVIISACSTERLLRRVFTKTPFVKRSQRSKSRAELISAQACAAIKQGTYLPQKLPLPTSPIVSIPVVLPSRKVTDRRKQDRHDCEGDIDIVDVAEVKKPWSSRESIIRHLGSPNS